VPSQRTDAVRPRVYNVIASVFVVVVIGVLGTAAYQGFFGSTSAAAPAASGKVETGTITVAIRGLAFPDGDRIVAPGTTVVWTNFDGAIHTVTSTDHSFGSGNLSKGQSFTHTFTGIGSYSYFCKIHSFMTATITVVQPYGSG
jgi:plastocyanin